MGKIGNFRPPRQLIQEKLGPIAMIEDDAHMVLVRFAAESVIHDLQLQLARFVPDQKIDFNGLKELSNMRYTKG